MINLVGYFSGELGLGVVARNLAAALGRLGPPPCCSIVPAGLGRDQAAPPPSAAPPGEIRLDYPVTLFVAGAVPSGYLTQAVPMVKRWSRLAILAYWELTELPPEAVDFLGQADVLCAGSPFTREVFQRYFPHKPCIEIPCPLGLDGFRPRADRTEFGLPERVQLVLTTFEPGSDTRRKNGEGAVRAFLSSCAGHDAVLVLKVNWPAAIPDDDPSPSFRAARELIERVRHHPRIRVLDQACRYERMIELYACIDVLVSLHRAEGLGLPMLEAMTLGRAVIATGYSGNLAFMGTDYAGLVPYETVPAAGTFGFYDARNYAAAPVWAEPDQQVAARLLARAVGDEAFAAGLRADGRRRALAYEARAMACHWIPAVLGAATRPAPLPVR